MIQVVIALAMGLAIFAIGLWVVRTLATPVPEQPDPDEVLETAVDYRCSVCGLQLVVTHAPRRGVKPPRHCREEMEVL